MLPVDLEDHIRHLANVVTVDDILTMEGETRKMKENEEMVVRLFSLVTQLDWTEISFSQATLKVKLTCTHVSVLATSSHPAVDVADAALRSNNQRSASVHNGLASTTASYNLPIDCNTE